jgi:hypothetical protein
MCDAPNARINPPDNNCASDKLTMKAMLIPVGLNELLGGLPCDTTLI